MEPAIIARVLLAVTPAANQGDIPSLLVQRLEQCLQEEKEPIARSLVEVLKIIPNEAADNYLAEFTQQLIFLQGDSRDDRRSQSLSLAAKLAMMHTKLLQALIDEGVSCLGKVISIAQEAHVSSDDGFVVPSSGFVEKFTQLNPSLSGSSLAKDEEGASEAQSRALAYLRLYEVILMDLRGESLDTRATDCMIHVLLVLLGHSNHTVASLSGKVLRLLLQARGRAGADGGGGGDLVSEMMYYRLQDLTAGAGRESHELYTIWLQWVSTGGCAPLQEMLKQDKYWAMIQHGMLRGFSAQRKICLQILNLSINTLRESFQNKHFIWDEKSHKSTILSWKKYATLFEIIVFDTSANQLKDALPELRRLLTPPSQIHRSWISVLLALALKNSSTSIQATAYELILSLKWPQLQIFTEGEDMLLTEHFLPYAMMGSLFSISGEHYEKCEHGEKLSNFLGSTLRDSPEQFAIKLVDTLLSYIIDRPDALFSPARIYVLLGIVEGIGKRRILGPSQIQKVVRVASNKRFSRTRAELAASLCLWLLFSARLEDTIEAKKNYLWSICSAIKDSMRVFGLREADAVAECILEGLTFPQDLRRLKGYDFSTRGAEPGADASSSHVSAMLVEQEGAQRALLTTLLAVRGEVDEKSVQDALGRASDADAAWILGISHIFDFGYPLIDALLSNAYFRTQLFETLITRTENLAADDGSITVDELCWKALSKVLSGFHLASQRPGSQIPHVGLNVLALKIFNAAWSHQRKAGQTKHWEAQKNRPYPLAACSAAVKILSESGSDLTISSGDVLNIIEEYPEILQRDVDFPREGSHANVEITKVIEAAINAAFSLLEVTLKREPSNHGQRVIDCINCHLRFITNQSLRPVVNCLKAASSLSSSTPKKSIIACAVELWDLAEQTRSGSDTQSVYLELFQLIFDPTLQDGSSAGELDRVSTEALKFSISRRGIAPALALAISKLPSEALLLHMNLIMGLINLAQLKEVDYLQEESLCAVMDRLKECTSGTCYNYYNGPREIVAQARIFVLLSRLDPDVQADVEFVRCLRRQLLEPWREAKNEIQFSAYKKTSQLQALLVTDRFVDSVDVDEFLHKVFTILNYETHPRYRFLFEWMIARVVIRLHQHEKIWDLLEPRHNLNPRTQVSIMKIAMMLVPGISEGEKQGYYEKLVHTIIPLITNSKVVVRHLAITSVLSIWKNAEALGLTSITTNPLLIQIRNQILHSPFYKELTPPERERYKEVFDPLENYTLLGIFHGGYLVGGDLVERITEKDFLAMDGDGALKKGGFISLGKIQESTTANPVEYPRTIETLLTTQPNNLNPPPLQTKSSTWTTDVPIPASPSSTATPPPSSSSLQPSLLLLASLITNPTNLGGLTRVSEIFGLTTLALSSPTTTLNNPNFLSASVSAHNWMHFTQVDVANIPSWLREMRATGYAIVGIEQTDQSVILGKDVQGVGKGVGKLPRRAVLMLGSEREGIPAELLGEVDLCVEIEQRGRTRSLNVQTAAAVVCYEWNRQWRQ